MPQISRPPRQSPLNVVLLLTLLIVGCDALDGSEASVGDRPSHYYYQDIKPIIDSKCIYCHDATGIAPFELGSFQSVFDAREAIKLSVNNHTMPPWLVDNTCNDYAADASLNDEEIQTIVDWVDSGAERGDSELEGEPIENPARSVSLTREDLVLSMEQPYAPTQYPDDYRCFILDWTAGADEGYVTGFRANPDNLSIDHHVVAFLVPPSDVPVVEARDAADPGYGYSCFGGPGGDGLLAWLGAWAPGSLGSDYPPGTGMKLEEGSKIVIQMHYNLAFAPPSSAFAAEDQTSISLKIDETVDKEAAILLWLDYRWVRNGTMDIPAGVSNVTHSFSADPTMWLGLLNGGSSFGPGDSFDIHWSFVHMHELGTHANLKLERASAEDECLLDIPRWDYNWQFGYSFKAPIRVNPGDKLQIDCNFSNTPEMQRVVNGVPTEPRDVNWGDGTQDEMCIGILYISQP